MRFLARKGENKLEHPKILVPGKMRAINNYLLEKTECFAFLLDDDLQWDYAKPQNAKEAFEIWSIALYVVYHDYGCYYLKYLLSNDNVMIAQIEPQMKRARYHYHDIVNCFRGNFAHGILDKQSRSEMTGLIIKKYLKKSRQLESLDEFTEEDWKDAAEQLRKKADELCDTLKLWADTYDRSKFKNLISAKKQFGESDCFKKSICERVLFESLDKDIRKGGGGNARYILDNNASNIHKNLKDVLDEWQNIIQNEFLLNKIKTDKDIIDRLKELLEKVYKPVIVSSVDVASECGYNFDQLLK